MGTELCFNYHCNGCREVIDVLDIFPSGNMETEGAKAGNTGSLSNEMPICLGSCVEMVLVVV